ncbi:hypothetical protein N7465_002806 [Penicillium sp. CMV-2018d]|nr:hypothetical protein N7465_002806 [Penicillium sp. CMV-2018d]
MFDDELNEYHVLPHGEPESTAIKRRKPTEFNSNRLIDFEASSFGGDLWLVIDQDEFSLYTLLPR